MKKINVFLMILLVVFLSGCGSKENAKETVLSCKTDYNNIITTFEFTYDEKGNMTKLHFNETSSLKEEDKEETIIKNAEETYCYLESGEKNSTCKVKVENKKIIIDYDWPLDELFEMPFNKDTKMDDIEYLLSNTGPDKYECKVK